MKPHMMSLSPLLALGLLTGGSALAAERGARCVKHSAAPYAKSISYCSSSELKSRRGLSYGPENLFDKKDVTAWCEGARGNGIGVSLRLRIEDGRPFRRLKLANGYAKTPKIYARNARLKYVVVTTDRGDRINVSLADRAERQIVELPRPAAYKWVSLAIGSVYPGSRYKDACLNALAPDYAHEAELERLARQNRRPRFVELPGVRVIAPNGQTNR